VPVQRSTGRLPGSQFRHSWTTGRVSGLDSTCLKCFTVVGTLTNELSLLVLEQQHECGPQRPTARSATLSKSTTAGANHSSSN